MSSKKGITLVALVITIVVLLILAGVSITAISGNNGVVTKATDAKKETDEAEAREELEQAIGAAQAEFSQIWMENVTSKFLDVLGTDKLQLEAGGDYTISYNTGTRRGTITKGENGTTYGFELEAKDGSTMGASIKTFKVGAIT